MVDRFPSKGSTKGGWEVGNLHQGAMIKRAEGGTEERRVSRPLKANIQAA